MERTGHICPNMQEAKFPFNSTNKNLPLVDRVMLDLDYYDPTIHAPMEEILLGDITIEECQMEWDTIDRILKEYSKDWK